MRTAPENNKGARPRHRDASPRFSVLVAEDLATGRHSEPVTDALVLEPLAVARALSTSPAWREMPEVALIVRTEPSPALGVVGYLDPAAEARLAALGPQLANGLASLRYVSYAQAEKDCERLGELLVERLGREQVSRAHFTGVPRGGHIVLGMLAYALGLDRAQLEPPPSPDSLLVVVDDCAFSGVRFGEFLARCESRSIVFAHLYSHPDLRTTIEAREPRVEACVGARNLRDHAPEREGAGYSAWKAEWLARLDGEPGYWIGKPDHLCFPWNEPDFSIWNPVTERLEHGWRVVPPELCLKNRTDMRAIPVQVQPQGPGPLRPSEHVVFGEFEGEIVVGNTETEASFTLAAVTADMWRTIVKHGNLDDAVTSLAGEYDVDVDTLRADLLEFSEQLLALDLLEDGGAAARGR